MKIIEVNGVQHKMYKPDEVANETGYHPRTIRRFIQAGAVKAVNSNKTGKQPVWWIPEDEIVRLKSELVASVAIVSENKKKKTVTVKVVATNKKETAKKKK